MNNAEGRKKLDYLVSAAALIETVLKKNVVFKTKLKQREALHFDYANYSNIFFFKHPLSFGLSINEKK